MKRILTGLLAAFLVHAVPCLSQWRSLGAVDSFSVAPDHSLHIYASGAAVRIEAPGDGVVRIRLAPGGVFSSDLTEAVVGSIPEQSAATIQQRKDAIVFSSARLSVEVERARLRIRVLDHAGRILSEDDPERGMAWDGRAVRVWKTMPEQENYYGFGLKSGRLNKKYSHLTMWNSDIPAYAADTDPLYESIPFFLAVKGGVAHGIFFNNSYWSSFDMGKESRDRYSFGAQGGTLDYYVIAGPGPKDVVSRFTALVGRMPLPPLWSLGYQQCRWSYYPEERVRELAKTFRDKKIPADVIYLDIDYMEGYRIFTWSEKNFPRPAAMIADLAAQGFKIAVILDPGIKQDTAYGAYRSGLAGDHFLKRPDGSLFIGKVWPGLCAFPDFTRPETRSWWGEQLKALVDVGVRGFWNDMNEPSVFDVPTKTVDLDVVHDDGGRRTSHAKNHNTYGLLMTKATREGVLAHRPAERPFVLTRASFAGGQRYSAAWTGDNVASWEHLQMTLPMCLNLGLSGQPFVGSDIGGFIGSPSGELYARWLQLGVFMPLMRTHTETGSAPQEPWSYGEAFERINRSTIELRYRLLPYIYTVMRQASETGLPAMRPMVLEHPGSSEAAWNQDQFYFGDHLLVAPVLWPSDTTRRIWLPEGRWFDFVDGKSYSGPSWVTLPAPIDRIPVLVKQGGVIPMQPVMQYVGQRGADPLTLLVCLADSSKAEYYEDDGLSFEYTKGVSALRTVEQVSSSTRHVIRFSAQQGSYRLARHGLELEIRGFEKRPSDVRAVVAADRNRSILQSWHFDELTRHLVVSVSEQMLAWELVITR